MFGFGEGDGDPAHWPSLAPLCPAIPAAVQTTLPSQGHHAGAEHSLEATGGHPVHSGSAVHSNSAAHGAPRDLEHCLGRLFIAGVPQGCLQQQLLYFKHLVFIMRAQQGNSHQLPCSWSFPRLEKQISQVRGNGFWFVRFSNSLEILQRVT